MDWLPLNFGILKEPVNWLIVLLMLFIAAIFLDLSRRYLDSATGSAE